MKKLNTMMRIVCMSIVIMGLTNSCISLAGKQDEDTKKEVAKLQAKSLMERVLEFGELLLAVPDLTMQVLELAIEASMKSVMYQQQQNAMEQAGTNHAHVLRIYADIDVGLPAKTLEVLDTVETRFAPLLSDALATNIGTVKTTLEETNKLMTTMQTMAKQAAKVLKKTPSMTSELKEKAQEVVGKVGKAQGVVATIAEEMRAIAKHNTQVKEEKTGKRKPLSPAFAQLLDESGSEVIMKEAREGFIELYLMLGEQLVKPLGEQWGNKLEEITEGLGELNNAEAQALILYDKRNKLAKKAKKSSQTGKRPRKS